MPVIQKVMQNFISQIYCVYVINLMWSNNRFHIYHLSVSWSVFSPSHLPFVPFLTHLPSYPPLPTVKAQTPSKTLKAPDYHFNLSSHYGLLYTLSLSSRHTTCLLIITLCSLIALCLGHFTYLCWNVFLPPFPSRLCKAFPGPQQGMSCVSPFILPLLVCPLSFSYSQTSLCPHGLTRRSPVCIPC